MCSALDSQSILQTKWRFSAPVNCPVHVGKHAPGCKSFSRVPNNGREIYRLRVTVGAAVQRNGMHRVPNKYQTHAYEYRAVEIHWPGNT